MEAKDTVMTTKAGIKEAEFKSDDRLLTDEEIVTVCGMLSINYRKVAEAQNAKTASIKGAQHQKEIEEIWKELEGHLKLDSDNDRCVILGHLKPYRNDGIDFVKMEWVGWYQSLKAKHRKE